MTMSKLLTYSELSKLETYGDRLDYLKLWDKPYVSPRTLSNSFYKSRMFRLARKEVMLRDAHCDLGVPGMYVDGFVIIHHMNPLVPSDFDEWTNDMIDPEFLITASYDTHNKIHYKTIDPIPERRPGDTKLW